MDEDKTTDWGLLARITSDMRSSISTILGYSDLILLDSQEGKMPETTLEYVQVIHNHSLRLMSYCEEILDIAKIDANQMMLYSKAENLEQIIENLLKEHEFNEKNLADIALVKDTEIPNIHGDSRRINQIITHLLRSARMVTRRAKQQNPIAIHYGKHNDSEVYIRVKDTGEAISKESLPFVFERDSTYRADLYGRQIGVEGLGLFITRNLVNLHGGEIHAESEPDTGTTLWFTLPIARL